MSYNFEIYENKYLFPDKQIKYAKYVSNHYGNKIAWHRQYKEGIVAKGRNITLREIAGAINNPSLLRYDEATKTADCYTNLYIEDASELIIKDETLRFHPKAPGGLEFAAGWGATLTIDNSTITSQKHYHVWNLTSTSTHFGYAVTFDERLQTWPGTLGHPGTLSNYESLQFISIRNSVINNVAHLFFDNPFVLRIVNTKITNLREVDIGRYYEKGPFSTERKAWTDFIKGRKGLWIMYKYSDTLDFELDNVTITGAKGETLRPTFLVGTEYINCIPRYRPGFRKLNLLNMDMGGATVVVRKSNLMGSFGTFKDDVYKRRAWQCWLTSHIGLVNCRFKDTAAVSDRA